MDIVAEIIRDGMEVVMNETMELQNLAMEHRLEPYTTDYGETFKD